MLGVCAAILIGGRARRLERRFKPLLPVGDRSILQRQLDAVRDAGIEQVTLVGRWPGADRPPQPVVADAMADAGAMGALYTALLVATEPHVIVMAGDMPFVTAPFLRALSQLRADEDVVLPRTTEGSHPLCAGYRRSIAAHLKAKIDRGELTLRAALTTLRTRELGPSELSAIDSEAMMLMNVNTTADYERALRHGSGQACPPARDHA